MSSPDSEENRHQVAAVIENKAKEVGLAVLDVNRMHLQMSQYIETSRSYVNTLTLLQLFSPQEVLVVASNHEVVIGGVNRACAVHNLIPIPRGDFDDTKGFLAVQQVCGQKEDKKSADCSTAQNYLAMGAAGALLRYMEVEKGLTIMCKSVQQSWIDNGLYMSIDVETVKNLELIEPLRIGDTAVQKGLSLFRIMNSCKTKAGSQLLKGSLLQPLVNIPTLQLRYDTVEELSNNPELSLNLSQCLSNFPRDLDKICGNLMLQPSREGGLECGRRIGRIVDAFLLLRELLMQLPNLSEALQNSSSPLLQTMLSSFQHAAFTNILQHVNQVVDEDARPSNTALIHKVNQCFAVKADNNGFLAMARNSLQKITDQIQELIAKYQSKYHLQDLKTPYNSKRGFYFTCVAPGSKNQGGDIVPQLPPYFQIIDKAGKNRVQCTTAELVALNNRLKNAYNDCLIVTEQILEGLLNFMVNNINFVIQLVDNVALLDMLLCFANLVCSDQNNYCKPHVVEKGPLVIVGGQHPVLRFREEQTVVQPNDVYMSEAASFHIITGPNMSGKSTYLRQVSLLVIMAQAGCFVPAEFCSLCPFKHLMSRIGSSDNLESNCSSFMVEMQEMSYILSHAVDKSLVIIDELGRATSTSDGIAIAWAIAEHLISVGSHTLFATHFQELCELSQLYPNCTLWHFDVQISDDTMDFTWKLKQDAQPQVVHYGLKLAPSVGIPADVITLAEKVVQSIENDRQNQEIRNPLQEAEQQQLKQQYNLADEVLCLMYQWRKHHDITKLPRQQILKLIQGAKALQNQC